MPPIRHKCLDSGCWVSRFHASIDVFDDCFPGRIAFADIDGQVERNGRVLVIEQKGAGVKLTRGQRIMFERLSRRWGHDYFPIVIWGKNDFSGPLKWQHWTKGKPHVREPEAVTLEDLKGFFRRWYRWADGGPV